MNVSLRLFYLITSLVVSTLASADVFQIPAGDWPGSIKKHKDIERPVEFNVVVSDENQYDIAMVLDDRPYKFKELETYSNKMSFNLDLGSVYSCVLERSLSNEFTGNCILQIKDKTRTIELKMQVPTPKEEAEVEELEDVEEVEELEEVKADDSNS